MNINLLRAQMALQGKKMKHIAKACKRSNGAMSKRMNLKSPFTQGDISAIANDLKLSRSMVFDIFFAEEVSQGKQEDNA